MSTARRIAGRTLAGLVVAFATFAVLEGAASLILFSRTVAQRQRPKGESRYTQYDSLLGWVAKPNVRIPDMYGPGRALTTNALGFRGAGGAGAPAPGRVRVVCSGDSFTLGFGVGDDDTWCARLARLDPRIETVNMGQGAYGIDQAALWYLRDGRALGHRVHIFAFITDDYRRMSARHFMGHPKPMLALEAGKLALRNVPVPTLSRQPVSGRLLRATRGLRIAELVETLSPSESVAVALTGTAANDTAIWRVAEAVFDSVLAVDRAVGAELLLVHMAGRSDYVLPDSDPWRARVAAWSAARGVVFVDLVDALRHEARGDVHRLFILPGEVPLPDAAGHPNTSGNVWVAAHLLPAVSRSVTRP